MKFEDLPKDQISRVFDQKHCDIDHVFFGFVDIYEALSRIVPKHFAVIDFGCAYNPQCVLFRDHKSFTAVDLPGINGVKMERFTTDNCTIHEMSIAQFICDQAERYDKEETFAICSYVPPWHNDNMKLVREYFQNVFVYYPHGGFGRHQKVIRKP